MMDLDNFIALAKHYGDMGWAVQEQLAVVLDGEADECNQNALEEIKKFLKFASANGLNKDDCEQAIEEIDNVLANV